MNMFSYSTIQHTYQHHVPTEDISSLPLCEVLPKVTMHNSVCQALTKQFELARVQKAREIPSINVLNEPDTQERDSPPYVWMCVTSRCGRRGSFSRLCY